ncbi:unnamed protein product, partial [marine sediment metagenome]
ANEAYKKNPDKFKKRKEEWIKNNPQRFKEINAKHRFKLKKAAFENYGGTICKCCGETEIDFLCLDHIDNDGAEHRKIVGGGNHFYRWLKNNKYPKLRLQVLCYNCNNSKKIRGYCVHQNNLS